MSHGHTHRLPGGKVYKSPTYHSWSSANDRCHLETHKWFREYGGRGIVVYAPWRRGTRGAFACFLAYLRETIGERPSKEMTLDRLDADKNYEPGNIRWATKSEQRLNQRRMNTETTDDLPVLPPGVENFR